ACPADEGPASNWSSAARPTLTVAGTPCWVPNSLPCLVNQVCRLTSPAPPWCDVAAGGGVGCAVPAGPLGCGDAAAPAAPVGLAAPVAPADPVGTEPSSPAPPVPQAASRPTPTMAL